MFSARRRAQPPVPSGSNPLIHNILALVGLGPLGTSDAEVVALVTDRIAMPPDAPLLEAADGDYHESAWVPCVDRTLLRIKVEYQAANGDRDFVIATKTADGAVIYSRVVTVENLGISGGATGTEGDDVRVVGNVLGSGGGLEEINCSGMAAYKLIVLPKTSGVVVDAWGGVG